jgi:hypothetical protein
MPFNPTTDLDTLDGLEPVTLHRHGESPDALGTTIAHAVRRAVTTREAGSSSGRYLASDVVWHLGVSELPESPSPGDVLCDADGRRWTVLDVARTTLGTRWRCRSRCRVLAYALEQTITVLVGTTEGEVTTWRPWKIGLAARIELAQVAEGSAEAARYRITIAEDLVLDSSHRIQGPGGVVYSVLGTTPGEQLGESPVIEAELITW